MGRKKDLCVVGAIEAQVLDTHSSRRFSLTLNSQEWGHAFCVCINPFRSNEEEEEETW